MEKYFYNTERDCVNNFLYKHPDIFDGTLPYEKEIFILMANKSIKLLNNSISNGFECNIDYNGYIEDFYEDIWRDIVKPILENNKNLMEMLDKVKAVEIPQIIVQLPKNENIEKCV